MAGRPLPDRTYPAETGSEGYQLWKRTLGEWLEYWAETTPDYKLSAHEGEEFIYVMEGEVEVEYGKEKYSLKEGDSIYYDSIVKHHLHGAPGKSAKILALIYIPF